MVLLAARIIMLTFAHRLARDQRFRVLEVMPVAQLFLACFDIFREAQCVTLACPQAFRGPEGVRRGVYLLMEKGKILFGEEGQFACLRISSVV